MRSILVRQVLGSSTVLSVFDSADFVIGRNSDVDYLDTEPSVSRSHLHVVASDNKIFIEDMSSANGTFVNESIVQAKTPVQVAPNDKVVLGKGRHYYSFEVCNRRAHKLPTPEAADIVTLARKQAESLHEETRAKVDAELAGATSEALRIITEAKAQAQKMASMALPNEHLEHYDPEQLAEHTKITFLPSHAEQEAEAKARKIIESAKKEAEALMQNAIAQTAVHIQEQQSMVKDYEAKVLRELKENEKEMLLELSQKEAQEKANLQHHLNFEKQKFEIEKKIIQDNLAANKEAIDKILADSKMRADTIRLEAKRQQEVIWQEMQVLQTKMMKEITAEVAEIKNLAKTSGLQAVERDIEEQRRKFADEFQSAHQELQNIKLKIEQAQDECRAYEAKAAELKAAELKIAELKTLAKQNTFVSALQEQNSSKVHSKAQAKLPSELESHPKANLPSNLNSELEAEHKSLEQKIAAAQSKLSALEQEYISESKLLTKAKKDHDNLLRDIQERQKQLQALERQPLPSPIATELPKAAPALTSAPAAAATQAQVSSPVPTPISSPVPRPAASPAPTPTSAQELAQDIVVESELVFPDFDPRPTKSLFPLNKKNRQLLISILVFITVATFVFPSSRRFVLSNLGIGNAESPGERYAKKQAQERNNRKYSPAQHDKVDSTYVDRVLYTSRYLEIKTNPRYIETFNRALLDWCVQKMKLSEDVVVKIGGIEGSLLSQLSERRFAIDPDFVDDGIQKMKKIELDYQNRLHTIFNQDALYDAFIDFSNKHFESARTAPSF